MPPLRNLVCQVEWDSPDNLPLKEYNITYDDGFVESYLAIPRNPTQFVIHLTSHGYIAPGLAMYVFIDGEYQCNRNRRRLLIPAQGVSRKDCEIDFRLRQKESSRPDGMWGGEQWKFEKVIQDSNDDENEHATKVGEYDGTIEVLVLRCYHSSPSGRSSSGRSSSTISTNSSRRSSYADDQEVPMMTGAIFDGAGDSPPPRHRRRSGRSRERAKDASPPAIRGRSHQHVRPREEKKIAKSRLKEEGNTYSRAIDDSSIRPKVGNEQQSPPILGIHGGAGSEGKHSKRGTPSPALSSKSYRLGSGDLPSRTKSPRGSTGSYTPDSTWGAPRPAKSKTGSTYSSAPGNKWNSGRDGHRNNEGQMEQSSWTWKPGHETTTDIPTSISNHERRKDKQEKASSTSSHRQDTTPLEDWNSAAQTQKEPESWDTNGDRGDETWDDNSKEVNRQEYGWDASGDINNDQLESGWAEVSRDEKSDGNGDQIDDWKNTIEDDKDYPNGNGGDALDQNSPWGGLDEGNKQQEDQDDKRGVSVGETSPHSRRWAKVGTTTTQQDAAQKTRSPKGFLKAASPAVKPTTSRRTSSKASSAASLKSALKTPVRSWASTKASPRILSDKVVEKVAAIPGAWSPPLEKAERKTRSESTKRKAAESNAERAKACAADLDVESIKAGGQRSKPMTPLSSVTFKPLSNPATSNRRTLKSKIFRTHRKRPSTIVEESLAAVDEMKDDDPTNKARPSSPAIYTHKICAPHYMDSIADPYAHFVFHYRDMAFISRMCNITIVETEEELRSRLASLTKQELLDLLVEERMAADEASDEKMTWKTSSDKAGYKPDLNAANEKLDEWGNNKTSSGESGWENKDGRVDEVGDSNDSGGMDASNSNPDNENQGGDSWGNGNEDNSGGTREEAGWNSSNDNAGGNEGWGDNNAQDNENGNGFGGGNGGDGDGGGGGW